MPVGVNVFTLAPSHRSESSQEVALHVTSLCHVIQLNLLFWYFSFPLMSVIKWIQIPVHILVIHTLRFEAPLAWFISHYWAFNRPCFSACVLLCQLVNSTHISHGHAVTEELAVCLNLQMLRATCQPGQTTHMLPNGTRCRYCLFWLAAHLASVCFAWHLVAIKQRAQKKDSSRLFSLIHPPAVDFVWI